jgi:leucyl aminopeptidase (aminopeptidase T)
MRGAAEEAGAEAVLMVMKPRPNHGSEPPSFVAQLMRSVDVVIAPTSKSLSHTQARRDAQAAGTRVVTLPNVSEETLIRTLSAGYEAIAERSCRVALVLDRGSTARLTTPAGSCLSFVIEGMPGKPDTGIVHDASRISNLPAGEACVAPVEGKTNGILVIDGSMAGIGNVSCPIKMLVKNGYVEEIIGGADADQLSRLIKPFGKAARNIAELGGGTNDRAVLIGNVLEDEKVLGTVHVAIGDNSSLGGTTKVQSHLDGVLLNPTLSIGDICLIKDGQLLIR